MNGQENYIPYKYTCVCISFSINAGTLHAVAVHRLGLSLGLVNVVQYSSPQHSFI